MTDEIQELISMCESQFDRMPLPLNMRDFLEWLETEVEHPDAQKSVRDTPYSWERWMISQNVTVLHAASWYARRLSRKVRKVNVSLNQNGWDLDYVTFTVEYAVTRNTTASGVGNEAVYVYAFSNDRDFVKVGLAGGAGTVRAAFERVMQQVSTSNRILPELLHVFFTDDCQKLESDLHRSLKDLGLWSYEGAGTEWFRADLETVRGLVQSG